MWLSTKFCSGEVPWDDVEIKPHPLVWLSGGLASAAYPEPQDAIYMNPHPFSRLSANLAPAVLVVPSIKMPPK